ncbi:magnesium transport protein CorA [Bacteroidia bacterium]|nr:magnesium transport protein CorA [Bacteroidia bacterium]
MLETIKFKEVNWINIPNPTDEDLDYLQDTYHFHHLDIEDCRSKTTQRPKIDIYDDYNFLILHFPYVDKATKILRTQEMKLFWGPDYIIIVGKLHWAIKHIFSAAQQKPHETDEFMTRSSDTLLYTLLDRLLAESRDLLLRVDAQVELINRDLFKTKTQHTIENISITRRNIILLNTIFKPQLRLFQKFESGKIRGYSNIEEMEVYWGNIVDYYQKMFDMVEDNAEIIEGLSKTYDSMLTNRTNEIMKVMTFISTFFLPLTFITGLYGMNVGLPLADSPLAFMIIVAVMVTFALTFIIFFRKKKWL